MLADNLFIDVTVKSLQERGDLTPDEIAGIMQMVESYESVFPAVTKFRQELIAGLAKTPSTDAGTRLLLDIFEAGVTIGAVLGIVAHNTEITEKLEKASKVQRLRMAFTGSI